MSFQLYTAAAHAELDSATDRDARFALHDQLAADGRKLSYANGEWWALEWILDQAVGDPQTETQDNQATLSADHARALAEAMTDSSVELARQMVDRFDGGLVEREPGQSKPAAAKNIARTYLQPLAAFCARAADEGGVVIR